MHKNDQKNEFPKYFLIDNEYTSDRHNIAMTFNEYYVNIGSKLAGSIRIPEFIEEFNFLGIIVDKNLS